MAQENVPPGSAQAASASATADQPGRPYYESLRGNLRQTLEKKRRLDEQLGALEEQIYKQEGLYLEETASSGNIVRGFDGWVKGVQVGRNSADDKRYRGRVRDEDRVFSRSSVTWMRVQGTDSNTPSHAPTPTGSFAPQLSARESNAGIPASTGIKAPNKKKRPAEKDDDDDSKTKRGKISYARD
ncbi:hypothetical protein DOTSEDRAFT_140665 [Dothistroma septosporum NZE10]|uniref:Chromatin modification-related protein EAF6 n=1 Tax=Dothistroma septosporum (strain NZE10 / CBS 128990) TaxID=675120 RepID=N1PBM6_DOTSN|nr:hypothetical protein DOTSEDRAFT_140665 [Dothistroma septosporum NZE10]